MKEEALIMTIDFGHDHFNAIYLNDQLKLIASSGSMITIDGTKHIIPAEKITELTTNLSNFFTH